MRTFKYLAAYIGVVLASFSLGATTLLASVDGPTSVEVGQLYTYSAYSTLDIDFPFWTTNLNKGTVENTYRAGNYYYAEVRWSSSGTDILKLRDDFDNVVATSGVILIAGPVGQVSITSGSNARCQGSGTSDYTASALDATSFTWSLAPADAGSISGTATTGTVTWFASYVGTATVYVTAHGINSSSSSTNLAVSVTAPNQYALSGPSSICSGATATLILSGSQPGASYQLFKNGAPNGSAKSGTGGSLSWTGATQGTYKVIATFNSCSSDMGSQITVGTTTPGTISISRSDGLTTAICQGSNLTLTASGGLSYYEWESTNTEGTHSWEGVQSINVSPNVTTTYYLYGNDAICGFSQSFFVTIEVTPLPTIPETIIPVNLTSRCQGSGSTTFSVVAFNSNSQTWSVLPQEAGSFTGNTFTWNPSFSGEATISVVAYGCNSSSVASSRMVTVHPLPTPSINSQSASVCQNTGYIYSTQTGMTGYSWSVNGGAITSGTGTNTITITWTELGAKSVSVHYTDPNGCTSLTPGVFNVTVNQPPTIANAGLDHTGSTTCGLTSLNLTGNEAIIGAGSWSIVSGAGGSIVNSISPTSTFNGTSGNSYVLRWSISYGTCPVSSDDVSIVLEKNPTIAAAGPDRSITFATGTPVTTLAANPALSGSGLWNVVNGSGGSVQDPTKNNSTFTGIPGVEYTLRWTIAKSPCVPSTDDVKILWVEFAGLGENFILTSTALTEGISSSTQMSLQPVENVSQSVRYFDGLGRPMQTVNTMASPSKLDLVQPIVYDAFGREVNQYLPIAVENNGLYKPNDAIIDATTGNYTGIAGAFYNTSSDKIADDAKPFAQTIFEKSPLNRTMKQGAAGSVWQPASMDPMGINDNTIKKRYETNASTDNIYLFTYDGNSGLIGVGLNRYYAANSLNLSKTLDEHNNVIIEFIDKEGRIVCKKVQYDTDQNGTKLYASTYYIYNDFGNLVVVLPPEAFKNLDTLFTQN